MTASRAQPDPDCFPRITAVIPALNEALAIAGVVQRLLESVGDICSQLIVVDNGSTDGTGALATAAGATVVREERRGYGSACLAGVLAATDADIIVLLDGDAADDPSDIRALLAPLLAGRAELVVGSRSLGARAAGSMTRQQVMGNRLTAWLMRGLYGIAVTDLGPLRAIRRADLLALEMCEMTYGWSVEMMVKAARAGYRYIEVPANYERRIGVSKVGGTLWGGLRAGWSILATTFRYMRWTPARQTVHMAAAEAR